MNIKIIEDPDCPPGKVYVFDAEGYQHIVQGAARVVFERGIDALPEAVQEAVAKVPGAVAVIYHVGEAPR